MSNTLAARDLNLYEVEHEFNLQRTTDPTFFPEWNVPLPTLSIHEQWLLDKAKSDSMYLDKYPLHEEIVKLVVLSPLLSVAGFYSRPFHPVAEHQIEIELEVTDERIRGRIDLLILNDQLWVTVIESKNKRFAVREALPQALLYLLSNLERRSPSYGLATNGSEFLFVKLMTEDLTTEGQLQYGFSRLFSLFNPENELVNIVGILKALSV